LVLHGIDKPNLWHGNTLTGRESYGGLFEEAPQAFDVILTNPPSGERKVRRPKPTSTQDRRNTSAVLQHVICSLRNGGRCGIVLDKGLLFRTNQDAFVKTKRKLLDDCDLGALLASRSGY
jgi:type I restriction enzyme M protein